MICPDGSARLIDLGLAERVKSEAVGFDKRARLPTPHPRFLAFLKSDPMRALIFIL